MNESRDLTPNDPRSPEELAQGRQGPAIDHPEAIDPRDTPEFALEPGLAPGPPPLEEPDVRRWLDRIGRVAAWVAGRFTTTPDDLDPPAWRFTDEELSELAPPATRVINRRLMWMAGVIRNADEIELGFLLLEYVDGNLERVRDAREAAEAAERQAAEEARPDLEPGDPARGPGSFGLGEEEGP